MKDNNNMLRGGKLKPEFYQSWANYFVKFIRAYESEGIPIWGVSIQNEPMATQKWESCIFSAEAEPDLPARANDSDRSQSGAVRLGCRLSLVRAVERRRADV
jgi:O-glycosyl hydrolase